MTTTTSILFYVNGIKCESKHSILSAILQEQGFHELSGCAVAVNEEVISRSNWSNKSIHNNDTILIITATQGG